MGQITDLVKENATFKDGFDIAKIEQLETELDPLHNLNDVDKALDFLNRNDILKRALHKHETTAIEKHSQKFNETKLPDILKAEREKWDKEHNPKLTDDQKKIRELSEKVELAEREKKASLLKSDLMAKAKELGYPHSVDIFMNMENAVEALESFHKTNQAYMDAEIEKIKKGVYKGNPSPQGGKPEVPPDIDEQIKKARSEGNQVLAMNLQLIKDKTQTQQ